MRHKSLNKLSLGKSMLKRHAAIALAVLVCLATAETCQALDTIRKTRGQVSGSIVTMNPYVVTIQSSSIEKEVPVNEILCVLYDREPSSLKSAKNNVVEGRYEDALEALGRVRTDDLSLLMEQDVAFYKALCAARIALGGGGDLKKAGSAMIKFVNANEKSYHFLEASEVVGDLLVAIGKYSSAEDYYKKVAAAPWDDYKMRAGVAVGNALLAQKKIAEAKTAFSKVVAMPPAGNPAMNAATQVQRLNANLGLARCMSAEGDDKKAVTLIKKIINRADPDQMALHARAYNTLGTAHRKAGRDKEALMAFLHVDLLYFTDPAAHAEALANLAQLWDKLRKTERAAQARNTLNKQYRNSPWTKLGG
jgi:tetratricopeptide (TPR) repeat protein